MLESLVAARAGNMEAKLRSLGGKGGKHEGSAGKPAGRGPRQHAHLLKKQRFNKIISDLAASKTFFMNFIRHPVDIRKISESEASHSAAKPAEGSTSPEARPRVLECSGAGRVTGRA